MKITYPDYDNCIANLANSILKKFGAEEERPGLPMIEPYLEKDYENIVILLLDGMGINIMKENLDEGGFFRTHLAGDYSSVFPPTTVAATTSMLSGLMPCEHSWLGWDCYFPQIDKNVTVFSNAEQETGRPAADYHVAGRYCGYENVGERIRGAGGQAWEAAPFLAPFPEDFEALCARIRELCGRPGKKYIYGYWSEPDGIMHREGCFAEASRRLLRELETQVEAMCQGLERTLLIVTADHGHRNSRGVSITDYPAILECLKRMPSIEPRALNLFVKEGMEERLEREFRKEFGDQFLLWTREQVIEKRLFGTGPEHECFRGMLGDYLAIAVDDLSIYNTREEAGRFIGIHAGLTEAEMRIPLIVIER